MHKPRITVLMPVYNAERFLAEAIESVLQQTFTDFEFLIIDDCSTDNSAALIQSYSDPRIRFYQNNTNLGIKETLNKGIQLSSADWIARLDSDDVCYPNRLQQQYDFMQAHPDGAFFSCAVQVVSENRDFIRTDNFNPEYFYYNLTFICWVYHPTVFYRKTAVEDLGGYTAAYSEDFELFWQLTRKYRHYHLPIALLDYRVTTQSLHQVVRKKEYKTAQLQQLLRNLRYYAGDDLTVSENCLECLQHNFEPLLNENSISSIVQCIRILDRVNKGILSKENVNRNVSAIKEAAAYKKRFILSYFLRNLPYYKGALLLLRLREFRFLAERLGSRFRRT